MREYPAGYPIIVVSIEIMYTQATPTGLYMQR